MFISGSVAPAQTEAANEIKRNILSRDVEYEKTRWERSVYVGDTYERSYDECLDAMLQ
jgi:hypothetical protein